MDNLSKLLIAVEKKGFIKGIVLKDLENSLTDHLLFADDILLFIDQDDDVMIENLFIILLKLLRRPQVFV